MRVWLAAIFLTLIVAPFVAVGAGGFSLFGFPSTLFVLMFVVPCLLLGLAHLGLRRKRIG